MLHMDSEKGKCFDSNFLTTMVKMDDQRRKKSFDSKRNFRFEHYTPLNAFRSHILNEVLKVEFKQAGLDNPRSIRVH